MNYKASILGRRHEQDLIREYYESTKAELVAVYGRRRVGKTYLVRQFFDNDFDFYFTGSFETPRSTQLTLFKKELERYSGSKHHKPKDWYEAFESLRANSLGWTRQSLASSLLSVISGTVGHRLYLD